MSSSPYPCSPDSRRDLVRALCLQAGACACGIAEATPVDDSAAELYDSWIAQGRHGTMDYLARYSDVRRDPTLLLEGARSVIVCAFAYGDSRRSPLFADYALGDDYHTVLRDMLRPVAAALEEDVPGSATRICIDTAPLRERYWAQRAGLGFTGLNNQLIIPGIGSAVFLATILWTADATADAPCLGHCSGCQACVRACPGKALDGNGGMDARRCLSYLTIEHRGELPDDISLPARIYGCDICRDVCPLGAAKKALPLLQALQARPEILALDIDAIRSLDRDSFSATFRRSAVKRAKLEGLLRNAARHKQRT
ncbi:MAG: tRNA epoxyqueuosine(34) reductase QueG [Muribaculaceae bacterium]|nr:tRNA epoxyqueuosine(34) reductase QueG [Muribaculaceae bacterium]